MSSYTFLWHDYETFGPNARCDRPAQFAAIRTDAQLNEIGAPIMHYCQPTPDFLPDPQSCLITGITPQQCLQRGLPEYQFAAIVEQALSESGTIGVGYNTIRFDDEITRFMFWRNLIDPYAREWQNRCGRWDILDVVRTTYALRPEGIDWPTHPDGSPSFKLEHLSAANGLAHIEAHDALSDVRATIALARLIREKQPRLFDFCLGLHKKDRVAQEIGLPLSRPFLHVSGMFPAQRGCLAIVWPLGWHPTNKNEMIVWDLADDPSELLSLDADTIRLRMFSKTDALPAGVSRLPIKSIHLNKSPIVIGNLNTLPDVMAQRWQLDIAVAMRHALAAPAASARLATMWRDIFQHAQDTVTVDVDLDLYGGFVGNQDRRVLERLRQLSPLQLAAAHPRFQDRRLDELLLRYRARYFPATLSDDEMRHWQAFRAARLLDGASQMRTVAQLLAEIESIAGAADARAQAILNDLIDYAHAMTPAKL